MRQQNDRAAEEVLEYARAAREQHDAILNGDGAAAASTGDRIAQLYRQLRATGRSTELQPLLASDDPSVRVWAAAHALEFAPAEAEVVLEALVREPAPVGLTAEMTLKEWRSGRLRFP